jgi:BirA family biotin operon repressor/biotin-[acetyl-CoA-carboxylase] ligase
MTPPREEWRLDTRRLGRRVLVFDRLPSTNDYAARLADDPANDGVAVLADEQTAGRGQHGRTWTAAPGSGVLLSLLLFPPAALRRPAVLTAWAAVAVCRTVQRAIGRPARIKWPNDVLVCGKKVCGILIEQGRGTVVGVGLNVRQTAEDFAAAELPEAASLAQFAASAPDTAAVARDLLRQLDQEFVSLLEGDVAILEACWKWHLGLLGREVTAECHHDIIHGRLRELSFAGVELERPGEPPTSLPPEKVLHLTRR